MEYDNFYRFSMVLSNNSSDKLQKYLLQFVTAILYTSDQYSESIQILVDKIKNEYDLEFSVDEIKDAISNDKHGNILIKDNTLTLIDSAVAKYNKLQEDNRLDLCIERFFTIIDDTSFSIDEAKKIIYSFLYEVFNSNSNWLAELIQPKKIKKFTSDFSNYNNNQINLINNFLNWEDNKKNEIVFKIITLCFDFCLLTAKKSKSSFANFFKGQKFYLDSNIIIRLCGLNGKDREISTKHFIEKCKAVGVSLYYTIYTKIEIDKVLSNQVLIIEQLTSKSKPISPNYLDKLIDTSKNTYYNRNFYILYYDWVQSGNSYNDFIGFKRYLQSIVSNILCKFKFNPNDSIEKNKQFDEMSKSLYKYKLDNLSKGQQSRVERTIDADINNLMLIKFIRNSERGDVFWNINTYMISSDRRLINWSTEYFNGDAPLVVYPSVWMSIILKLHGRAKNDYETFCKFINVRYHNESDSSNLQLITLVKHLQKLTNDDEIKNRLIDEIVEEGTRYRLTNESIEDDLALAYETVKEDLRKEIANELSQEESAKNSNQLNLLIRKKAESDTNKKMKSIKNFIRLYHVLRVISAIVTLFLIGCISYMCYF